jgi:hypothetical protein
VPYHDPESEPPLSHDPESDPPESQDPESDPPESHDPESEPPLSQSHDPESDPLDEPESEELQSQSELLPEPDEGPLSNPPPPPAPKPPVNMQQPSAIRIRPTTTSVTGLLLRTFMDASQQR